MKTGAWVTVAGFDYEILPGADIGESRWERVMATTGNELFLFRPDEAHPGLFEAMIGESFYECGDRKTMLALVSSIARAKRRSTRNMMSNDGA